MMHNVPNEVVFTTRSYGTEIGTTYVVEATMGDVVLGYGKASTMGGSREELASAKGRAMAACFRSMAHYDDKGVWDTFTSSFSKPR
jgi:hypothetical protein